jgi:radial spoke head protein 4A
MFGTNKDYYVVEGILSQTEDEKAPCPDFEARGTGVNKLVYWVTEDVLSDWVQLPDAAPHHINQSRFIKHMFTGDLNAPIDTNPPFLGKERHLLRAQIARISHSTTIIPKDMYKPQEENDRDIEYNEEFGFPSTGELTSFENWSHLHPIILNSANRTSHYVDLSIPEEEREELLAKKNEENPVLERLKGVNEDTRKN